MEGVIVLYIQIISDYRISNCIVIGLLCWGHHKVIGIWAWYVVYTGIISVIITILIGGIMRGRLTILIDLMARIIMSNIIDPIVGGIRAIICWRWVRCSNCIIVRIRIQIADARMLPNTCGRLRLLFYLKWRTNILARTVLDVLTWSWYLVCCASTRKWYPYLLRSYFLVPDYMSRRVIFCVGLLLMWFIVNSQNLCRLKLSSKPIYR